jgi:hypothetical protein
MKPIHIYAYLIIFIIIYEYWSVANVVTRCAPTRRCAIFFRDYQQEQGMDSKKVADALKGHTARIKSLQGPNKRAKGQRLLQVHGENHSRGPFPWDQARTWNQSQILAAVWSSRSRFTVFNSQPTSTLPIVRPLISVFIH